MVREVRFSFDDHVAADLPLARDTWEDLDDLVFDDEAAAGKAARTAARKRRRAAPIDQRTDRRHLAGADWMNASPDRPS